VELCRCAGRPPTPTQPPDRERLAELLADWPRLGPLWLDAISRALTGRDPLEVLEPEYVREVARGLVCGGDLRDEALIDDDARALLAAEAREAARLLTLQGATAPHDLVTLLRRMELHRRRS
jgi:hypothetical protein